MIFKGSRIVYFTLKISTSLQFPQGFNEKSSNLFLFETLLQKFPEKKHLYYVCKVLSYIFILRQKLRISRVGENG